jgi:hypothetical protein
VSALSDCSSGRIFDLIHSPGSHRPGVAGRNFQAYSFPSSLFKARLRRIMP